MTRYLVQFKLSQALIKAFLESQNDRMPHLHKVFDELGGKLLQFELICGTNRGFHIVEASNIDTLHVFYHSNMAVSGLEVVSIEEIIPFEVHAKLLKDNKEKSQLFKMPGKEHL